MQLCGGVLCGIVGKKSRGSGLNPSNQLLHSPGGFTFFLHHFFLVIIVGPDWLDSLGAASHDVDSHCGLDWQENVSVRQPFQQEVLIKSCRPPPDPQRVAARDLKVSVKKKKKNKIEDYTPLRRRSKRTGVKEVGS